MTSRVSFHKLVVETLRRHLAAVLISVLAFFIHIIVFFLDVQNAINMRIIEDAASSSYPSGKGLAYVTERLAEFSAPNIWTTIMSMILGVFLAFDFFRYMHSKRETDLYDSLPIKRQKLFCSLAVCSFGIFFLLAAITFGIEIGIIYSVGYGSVEIVKLTLWNLLCVTCVFLACWVTTAMSMIMTGHSIIAFLGLGVFATYAPLIINYLIPTYAERFFNTFVYREHSDILMYLSPFTLGYKLTFNYDLWNIQEHFEYLIGIFLFIAAIGLISYLLFLRRPSETAGRAMAFEKANFVIRFLLVIPLALYVGFYLSMAGNESMAWLIFGVLFATFLLHGIIECIFQFDIRALFAKKIHLIISMILCLGFIAVFWSDLFGYDEYLPSADEVAYIEAYTYLRDLSYHDDLVENDWLTGDNIELALKAAKDTMVAKESYDELIVFTYHLKNGMKKSRRYTFQSTEVPESLDRLVATEDFKNDFCGLYHIDSYQFESISYSNGIEEKTLLLSEDEMKELHAIYMEELTQMTYSQIIHDSYKYEIIFNYKITGEELASNSDSYYVYSNCSKTIAFLEEHNAKTFQETEEIELIMLEIYDKYYDDQRYINDVNSLNALKEYMILDEYMSYSYNYDEYVYCNLRFRVNGNISYTGVYIKDSELQAYIYK